VPIRRPGSYERRSPDHMPIYNASATVQGVLYSAVSDSGQDPSWNSSSWAARVANACLCDWREALL